MNKEVLSPAQAAAKIKENDVLMIGGFLTVGEPTKIIEALVKLGTKGLTIIGNDSGYDLPLPDGSRRVEGIGKLTKNDQVRKIIASYIGANVKNQEKMATSEIETDLTPQGTLAEQIRAAGVGLGGVLTPTGVGTLRAKGRKILTIDGKKYLLEKPLHADVALIRAKRADRSGNLVYHGTAQNFNPLMAMAAKLVIAEVDEIIDVGEIHPGDVVTPGIFVDYLVM
ncbi:MAG: CoA transferase subunit A [Pseudomonadota bacterium]